MGDIMHKQRKQAFLNGRIFTSDDRNLYAEAMTAEDGVITWVGRTEDLPAGEYERVDLGGRRVLPGFVDAHMHPAMLAEFCRQISCLPPKIHSIEELTAEIRRTRARQGAGRWILGWGSDEGKFAEGRAPDRRDLDRACDDAPVYMARTCTHIVSVNSRALELAAITRETPDPDGGQIDRDASGEPTGILRENAVKLVERLLPKTAFEGRVRHLLELGTLLSSQGITAITDMGAESLEDGCRLYEAAAEQGFRQRVSVYYLWEFFMENPGFSIPPELSDPDRQVHAAGLKLISDGSVSGRTAWVRQPYLQGGCGISVCTDRELETAIAFCRAHRCQLSVHAMGGRAIDRIVDRMYAEKSWMEDGTPCLRMEHVTEPSERAIARAAEKGFAFATQPIFPFCEIESYLANLGPERTKRTYPVKALLERGVPLCFSTDAPATSWAVPSDPFPCIQAAVTRRAYDGTDFGQDQRIGVETAIQLYTRNAARIAGFRNIGQLRPGFRADFILLSQDILAVPPQRIQDVQVQETYLSGERIFKRGV